MGRKSPIAGAQRSSSSPSVSSQDFIEVTNTCPTLKPRVSSPPADPPSVAFTTNLCPTAVATAPKEQLPKGDESSGAPVNPKKRTTPPTADKPAAKRERKDISPAKRPPHVMAIAVWDLLCSRETSRTDFTMKEMVDEAEKEWAKIPATEKSEKKLARWRRDFLRVLKKPAGMFRKAERLDAPQDSIVLTDRNHAGAAKRRGDASAGKRGDFPLPVMDGDEAAGSDTAYYGATIPPEWKAEMYKPVRLSTFDKSTGISFINEKENVVTGIKGFRTIRSTTGVCAGDWFFEVEVLPTQNVKAAVRVGWSMRRCDPETPVGFDTHGFGIRDRSGEFVHIGYRKQYGESFQIGDTIGCRIVLPELTEEQLKEVVEADERWLKWRFMQFKQGPAPADSGIDLWPKGKVEFYKNGKFMGIPAMFQVSDDAVNALNAVNAQEASKTSNGNGSNRRSSAKMKNPAKESTQKVEKKGIRAGYYYPSISLFKEAVARANFGPDFKYSLPEGSRPMCEAAKDPPPEPQIAEPSTSEAEPKPVREGEPPIDVQSKVDQSRPMVSGAVPYAPSEPEASNEDIQNDLQNLRNATTSAEAGASEPRVVEPTLLPEPAIEPSHAMILASLPVPQAWPAAERGQQQQNENVPT